MSALSMSLKRAADHLFDAVEAPPSGMVGSVEVAKRLIGQLNALARDLESAEDKPDRGEYYDWQEAVDMFATGFIVDGGSDLDGS